MSYIPNNINENPCSIIIYHRDKIYSVDYIDFSNKSSFKEVIGLPHAFEIKIDNILQTDSVDALVQHINTRNIDGVINDSNVLDLNFLAHLYGFYLLQSATISFILSKIPVNRVFETFVTRKNVEGYVQSFAYYFTQYFDSFVCDPSFYSLPFNVIEHMLDKNASELSVDDIIQFTINTYYKHGKKALSLLEKADKCRNTLSEDHKQSIQDNAKSHQNSKSPLRNIFFQMIDSDENNTNSETNELFDSNDNNNLFENDDTLFSDKSIVHKKVTRLSSTDNFSVKYRQHAAAAAPHKKAKRGGRVLERDASTASLIKLYATIAADRPYPHTQYVLHVLSKRRKEAPRTEDCAAKQAEELRYNISSLYIALLETTQGNKSAAYVLLASLYESGKIDYMSDRDVFGLYRSLADIPAERPLAQAPSSSSLLLPQSITLSYSELGDFSNDLDRRLLHDDFDWGAHGLYMMYRIFQEGLFGVQRDTRRAQAYLRQSADRGYKEAYFKLAGFIVSSPDFLTIKEDRLAILQKAADLGNGDYQYAYASCLAERKDKLRNAVMAVHYFRLAMLSGHPNAKDAFGRLQCDQCKGTLVECTRTFARAMQDKNFFMLKAVADCGFQPAVLAYPSLLSREDCSPLNPDRPMDAEMQFRDVVKYFKAAIRCGMMKCHFGLAIFTLKHASCAGDVTRALEIAAEGHRNGQQDASLLYGRLLLRLLGRSFRKEQMATDVLSRLAASNFQPAVSEMAALFAYSQDDASFAMNFVSQLHSMRDPAGSARYLYTLINDPSTPKKTQAMYAAELKQIADADASQTQKDERDPFTRIDSERDANLPQWLYAKVLLEGKYTTDFKAAVGYLKRAPDFPPAQVLLTSLSFQFGSIVSTGFSRAKFLSMLRIKAPHQQQQQSNLPLNFDKDSLPLPTATNALIKKFAKMNDATFRYKLGCFKLAEDEESGLAYELIRQSADAGSICGMVRYGLLRLKDGFRQRNEHEALSMFKRAGLQGLSIALILYARVGMRYSSLRGECLQMLRSIRLAEATAADQAPNYVTCRTRSSDSGRLRMALGGCLGAVGHPTSLEESEYHLTSLINEYTQQSSSESGLDGSVQRISGEDFAISLFYYGSTLARMGNTDAALDMLAKSYQGGYRPAAAAYADLLIAAGRADRAIEFLLDSLRDSLTYALYKLGSMTLFESGSSSVSTCIAESQAVDFIKLATLAEDACDNPDALWKFGTMLRDGFMVARDDQAALFHFYRAAENGSIPAVVAVGEMSLKMASKSSSQSAASHNTAVALACFTTASSADSPAGRWCRAQCLLRGLGCRRDVVEAVRELKRLADRSDRDAMYKLGKAVFNASKGQNGKVNFHLFDIGIRLILNAARMGHSTAVWRVGLFILQGQIDKNAAVNILAGDGLNFFVDSKEKVAAFLFKKSADLGNPRGAQLLSLCLENAIGVERNENLAKFYATFNPANER